MSAPFSALLLAGGKSRRMGRDKTFLVVNGEPMWRRQLTLLETLAPKELLIAGPNHADWLAARCEILHDAVPDSGPLGGIVAGLRRITTRSLLVLAIDLPLMTADFLAQLIALSTGDVGVVPKQSDRFQPLAAVYPKASLPLAENALQLRDHSVQRFAALCVGQQLLRERMIFRDEEQLFLNANTPADFAGTGELRHSAA